MTDSCIRIHPLGNRCLFFVGLILNAEKYHAECLQALFCTSSQVRGPVGSGRWARRFTCLNRRAHVPGTKF